MQFTLDCLMMIAGRHSGQSSLAQGWTGARDDERHFIFNKFSAGRMFTFDLMRQHTKHHNHSDRGQGLLLFYG